MKRSVLKIFAAAVACSALAFALSACEEGQAAKGTEGLYFFPLSDGTYAVAQGNTKYLEEITIPIRYKGKKVTAIAEDGFAGAKLQSIIIPDSVTSIGNDAFYNCSSLTSITIPDSVTSIGNDAFRGCSGLTSITIPGSVTSIGSYAFYNCDSLTSVTIGDGVTSIGNYAFAYCSSLTSVTFENPNGWWLSKSSTATSGTNISRTSLSNPSIAAGYLKSTYYVGYYWKRS